MKGKGVSLGVSLLALALFSSLVLSCKGPTGDKGPDGTKGPQGDPGPDATTWVFINQDTTWGPSDGPIVLKQNVMVSEGVTLTILPGTVIKFYPDIMIYVAGTLKAEGTASQQITFRVDDDFVDLIESFYGNDGGAVSEKAAQVETYEYYYYLMGVVIEKKGHGSVKNCLFDNYLVFQTASQNSVTVDSNRFNGGEIDCSNGAVTVTNNIISNGSISMEYNCRPTPISGNAVGVISAYLAVGLDPVSVTIKNNRVFGSIELEFYNALDTSDARPRDGIAAEIGRVPAPLPQASFEVSDNTIVSDPNNGWATFYLDSYDVILNGVVTHNDMFTHDTGVYVYLQSSDTTTFSNIEISYNNIEGNRENGTGMTLYDFYYSAWINAEHNNVTNVGDWGIVNAGTLRNNYIAGNRGAPEGKADTSAGGAVDHVYNTWSSSSPQQWAAVDACFYPRSSPEPDAGPR